MSVGYWGLSGDNRMKITGRTKEQLDKEKSDKELAKIIDNAQIEAEELLQAILRKIALDKLVSEGI